VTRIPSEGWRLGLLAETRGHLERLELRSGREVRITPLLEPPEPVLESAVHYAPDGRPLWAALLESGALVHRDRGEAQPARRARVRPLQLVASQGLAYLLVADVARGPKLDELRSGHRPALQERVASARESLRTLAEAKGKPYLRARESPLAASDEAAVVEALRRMAVSATETALAARYALG